MHGQIGLPWQEDSPGVPAFPLYLFLCQQDVPLLSLQWGGSGRGVNVSFKQAREQGRAL
jgi:hypothetical protein